MKNLEIAFFYNKSKLLFIANIIQKFLSLNTKEKTPSHVGLVYSYYGSKRIIHLKTKGVLVQNFGDLEKDYKGEIKIIESDTPFSEQDFVFFFQRFLDIKYSALGAIGSFSLKFKSKSNFFNKITQKIASKYTGRYNWCSSFVAELLINYTKKQGIIDAKSSELEVIGLENIDPLDILQIYGENKSN